jgi:hypothetical protein
MKTRKETREFFSCEICGYEVENCSFIPITAWHEIIKKCEALPIQEKPCNIGDVLNVSYKYCGEFWMGKYVEIKVIDFKLEKFTHECILCFDREILTDPNTEYGDNWESKIPIRAIKIITNEEIKNYELDNSLIRNKYGNK